MWVAPWRRVGISVLLAALALSVYAAGQSGSVRLDATSLVEFVRPVELVRPLAPVATTLVRPPGVVSARPLITSEASSIEGMITAIRVALGVWSEFVGSGDVTILDGVFDPEGPQHRQLASEVLLLGDAVWTPRFDLVGIRLATRKTATALVDTWIVLAVGDDASVLQWRFHLTPFEGRWRVWTIEERAAGDHERLAFSSAAQ